MSKQSECKRQSKAFMTRLKNITTDAEMEELIKDFGVSCIDGYLRIKFNSTKSIKDLAVLEELIHNK